ncbi:hypothetical protein BJ165DRAFT_1405642 [Panaeolus papilionaceus]|nr:hypothetical protein BJ165DRAFT_1405642 [Panaeolus papilionaceus]
MINKETTYRHPLLNGLPSDDNGAFLSPGTPRPPAANLSSNNFSPFQDRAQFRLVNLLYRKSQVSGTTIDELVVIWAETLDEDTDPPFLNKQHMYDTMDAMKLSDVPWQSFTITYNRELTSGDKTSWKHEEYEVFFRILVQCCTINSQTPTSQRRWISQQQVTDELGSRRYRDLVAPIGSDKTAVSLATGQNRPQKRVTTMKTPTDSAIFVASFFIGQLRPLSKTSSMKWKSGDSSNTPMDSIGEQSEQVLPACIVQNWCPGCDSTFSNLDGKSVTCSY